MALSLASTAALVPRPDGYSFGSKRLTTIAETQDDQPHDRAPRHPIPSLQDAFDESLVDHQHRTEGQWPATARAKVDSATRRRRLLQEAEHEDTHAARWRQSSAGRFHPLTKLVAQISFGIHLLQNSLATSDEEVVALLQTYVAEIDAFLEQTTEDFNLALQDIDERIKCLRLPLEHDEVFDAMLEDRVFRQQIVDGNEKIEHIISRTETAMNDALDDVQKGLEATKELAKYLVRLDRGLVQRTAWHEDVYAAMSGNAEGWFRCFFSLQSKGHTLNVLMMQLGSVVGELQRRAGIASRKNIASLLTDKRACGEDQRADNATSHSQPAPSPSVSPSPSPLRPLPQTPHRVPSPQGIQQGQQRLEPPNPMPRVESLSPSSSNLIPIPLNTPSRQGSLNGGRSSSLRGDKDARALSSRASTRTQTTATRRSASRDQRDFRADSACSSRTEQPPASLSHRSSIGRLLSFTRRKKAPGTPSSLAPAHSSAEEPLRAPDSAYSSGESVAETRSVQEERVCSPTPTYTSDLHRSKVPSSSRIAEGKAAAVMGTMPGLDRARQEPRRPNTAPEHERPATEDKVPSRGLTMKRGVAFFRRTFQRKGR